MDKTLREKMAEYSPSARVLAEKLFGYFKESMEKQGVPYASWGTVNDRAKLAFLEMAEKHISEKAKK